VIAKNVELGTVISSPTKDVGGGTVLLTMANLDTVQIRTRVDETDIGKIQPGLQATITVEAYPNRMFSGRVLKIEPQATVEQNVTMFPALVRIANPGHVLMPGMNAEVEIHIGRREDVVAVPYAALRTPRDLSSAVGVLGLDPKQVEEALGRSRRPAAGDSARARPDSTRARPAGGRPRGGGGAGGSGSFIVFVLRDGRPEPTMIRTGLTDLDFMEVLDGVAPGDTVAVLPSASLVDSQERMRERIERLTGGGIPGMQQQQGGQTSPPRR
jgi:HlyD family secretion protein